MFFFKFYIWLSRLKKLKLIQFIFELVALSYSFFRYDEKNLSSHVDFSYKRAREVYFRLKPALNYSIIRRQARAQRFQDSRFPL